MDSTRSNKRTNVPAIGFETKYWSPTHPEIFPNAQVQRQTGPYDSALIPGIEALDIQLDASLQAQVEEASQALQEFDTYSLILLGAKSPELGPMANILLRTESTSSSQIEQLSTSAKQLALSEISESEKSNARTVIGNVRAMEAALALSEQLDVQSILAMHHALLSHQLSLQEEAGKLRQELVWIGGKDTAGPRGADYIAPQPEHVRPALEDLVKFIRRRDLPALTHIAIAHAQFETIHPFVDGNGRTGRALTHAMMRARELTKYTTAPISAGILRNTSRYFKALGEYRGGNALPIIEVFVEAAIYAASTGQELISSLADELNQARIQLQGVRSNSVVHKVLPLLVSQPVLNTSYLKAKLGLGDTSVHRALATLVEHGVLEEKSGLRRNRVWQHQGILNVLDEYAKKQRRDS